MAGKRQIVAGEYRYVSPFTSRLLHQKAGKMTRVRRQRMRMNCLTLEGIGIDWKKPIQTKETI